MTSDWSDPLPAKQWFCFKFPCHSCSPQNQRDLRLPRPTERSHGTCLKTRLHRVEGALFSDECKVAAYARGRQTMTRLIGGGENSRADGNVWEWHKESSNSTQTHTPFFFLFFLCLSCYGHTLPCALLAVPNCSS